jgi:predicted nucleotidyltransferase
MHTEYKDFFSEVVRLLEKEKIDYFFIGGLAVNVLGEPRMTQDIDLIAFISKKQVQDLLKTAEKIGFKYNKAIVEKDLEETRTFKLFFGIFHLDIILSSTEFENEALKRKTKIDLWKHDVFFPTPEDMIILKVIPGRPKDLLDASSVFIRNKNKIDVKYIEKWIQFFCDEAEDMRIYNNFKKVISGELF